VTTLTVAAPPRDPDAMVDEFARLTAEWKAARRPTSSARRMADHPAYQAIIRLGRPVVPLILAELRREPDHWFIALAEITGAVPVPAECRGNLTAMTEAWEAWWGEANR
jgi:hypothetical protein